MAKFSATYCASYQWKRISKSEALIRRCSHRDWDWRPRPHQNFKPFRVHLKCKPEADISVPGLVPSILKKNATDIATVATMKGEGRAQDGRCSLSAVLQREAAAAMAAWFWNVVELGRKLEAERAANSRPPPDNVRMRTKRVA